MLIRNYRGSALALVLMVFSAASVATPSFEAAKPALTRLFSCQPAKNESFETLEKILYSAGGIEFEKALMGPPQKLAGTLEIAGVQFDAVNVMEGGGIVGYSFPVYNEADLKKLIKAFKMKRQKDYFMGDYDYVRTLRPSFRVAVSTESKSFACFIGEQD